MAPRNQSKTNANTPKTGSEKKKTRVQKTYAPVSLTDLKPVKLAAADKVTVIPGRERSAEQKAVDATVKDLAFEYLAAGSPKQFRDMPVVSYTLPTEQAATVRFMVQKACNLLNCKPKFGRQAWDGGNEVVSFCAIPRDAAQWTDKPSSDPITEAAAAAVAAEAENEEPAEPEKTDDKPADLPKKTDPSAFMKNNA
jgi:hypothetical protein